MANNQSKAIDEILNDLIDEISDARAVPLSKDTCFVNREHLLDLIEDALDNLPEDIAQARSLIQTKEKIISDANARAEGILNDARETAKRLVSEHEIVQAATKRAHDLTVETEAKVADLKKETISYVNEKLSATVSSIESSLNEIKELRKNILNDSPSSDSSAPHSKPRRTR